MPDVKVFIDTNVLLYTRQNQITEKVTRAEEWLVLLVESGCACINLQVLNEMTNVLLRKRNDLTALEIFDAVDELLALGAPPITKETIFRARELRLRFSYSWWDCLLLASALELGCKFFLSEDMHDGHDIDGLTIINPFMRTPSEILARY